jgi:hypothetical protein
MQLKTQSVELIQHASFNEHNNHYTTTLKKVYTMNMSLKNCGSHYAGMGCVWQLDTLSQAVGAVIRHAQN